MTRENTVLHFDRSRSARAFSEEESLWQPEIEDLLQKINRHQDLISQSGSKDENRPFLSLAIFGGYGSGKTSLLKTLVDRVRPSRNGADSDKREEKYRRIYSLPILTLTDLSKEEHFLYAVLAAILKDEEDRLEHERKSRSGRQRDVLSPVKKSIHRLSEHLHVLDEIQGRTEHDPMGLSIERLERHSSDMELRKEVGTLIDKVAETALPEYGEDSVILLPVDDADMSQKRLTSSLETCHRYLKHPRLIPIFTLMGRIAEGLMRHKFSEQLVQREASPNDLLLKAGEAPLEEQIAVQYLAKTFPVRNRVRIGSPTKRLHAARFHFSESGTELETTFGKKPKLDKIDFELPVVGLLETATHLLFGFPEPAVSPRVPVALRPATLRRQLQVLDGMYAARLPHLQYLHDGKDQKLLGAISHVLERKGGKDASGADALEWSRIFDRAAWSLLDLHRDVLKDLDLFLDEIIGWDARSLRERLLERLLLMDQSARSHVLQAWRHQATSLRSQVYSLLGTTVFRPRHAAGEARGEKHVQPTGETEIGDDAASSARTGDGSDVDHASENEFHRATTSQAASLGLDERRVTLWFLDLWLGFYYPLWLLGRRSGSAEYRQQAIAGWNLHGAADQIVRLGLERGSRGTIPGLAFLSNEGIDELSQRVNSAIIADTAREAFNMTKAVNQLEADEMQELHSVFEELHRQLESGADKGRDKDNEILKKVEACKGAIGRLTNNLKKKQTDDTKVKNFKEAWNAMADLRPWLLADDEMLIEYKSEASEMVEGMLFQALVAGLKAPDGDTDPAGDKERQRDLWSPEVFVLLSIWTSYGYDSNGDRWAAVNLWRGLGLLGSLLVLRERGRLSREAIERKLRSHIHSARISVPSQIDDWLRKGKRGKYDFGEWKDDSVSEGSDRKSSLSRLHFRRKWEQDKDSVISELADDIKDWLDKPSSEPNSDSSRTLGLLGKNLVDSQAEGSSARPTEGWESDFLRRLHGFEVLGRLLPALQDSLYEPIPRQGGQPLPKDMDGVLVSWTRVLVSYWSSTPIQEFLKRCPFLEPFSDEGLAGTFQGKNFKVQHFWKLEIRQDQSG